MMKVNTSVNVLQADEAGGYRASALLNSQSRPRFVYIRPLDEASGREETQH